MKKVEMNGTRYFIRDVVAEAYEVEDQSELRLLQLSDFAIKGNEVIKCRYDIEDVIKVFVESNCL